MHDLPLVEFVCVSWHSANPADVTIANPDKKKYPYFQVVLNLHSGRSFLDSETS